MNWYSFNPMDTLFFRGAEPMNIGENHTVTANFPPPTATLQGAIRTAILEQHQISIDDYYNHQKEMKPQILEAIGIAGSEAKFQITGPLLSYDEQIYIPAPYSWFVKDERNLKSSDTAAKNRKPVKILKSQTVKSSIIIEENDLYWVKTPEAVRGKDGKVPEMKSIGSFWIPCDDIENGDNCATIRPLSDFCVAESRTGIALNRNRSVREGHLYTFTHYRLRQNVELLFGIDKDLPLDDTGILKLGAEQRFGKYQKLKDFVLKEGSSETFLALSQIKGTELSNQSILASGKIKYIGGWDMKKGFHKPMIGYFPPGTVFKERLNANFIQL